MRHFDEVEAFVAVLEAGSFSAAAKRLCCHPSMVSRRIKALEGRLGARLIERSTRSMAATEVGRRYFERMRTAFTVIVEADAEVQESVVVPRGTLRLALPLTFGERVVAPILPAFLERYTEIRIEASYSDRFVDMIAEGFDVAIRIGKQDDSRLIARRLGSHLRGLYAAPGYLERRGELATPKDLKDHACIRYTGLASHPHWHFDRDGIEATIRVDGPLDADDPRSLLPAALAGVGIAMLPDWLADQHVAAGRLVRVMRQWRIRGSGDVIIVRPSIRFAPAKTKAFIDWIVAAVGTSWAPSHGQDPGLLAGHCHTPARTYPIRG